jgi:hypothetical protein
MVWAFSDMGGSFTGHKVVGQPARLPGDLAREGRAVRHLRRRARPLRRDAQCRLRLEGWDSIHNAASRLGDEDVILYFGDFDPSGEDMVRSLRDQLDDRGSRPEITKCALTFADIERYELAADFTTASDTQSAAFVAKWGDVSVELDALPIEVLRGRIVSVIESRMDLDALERARATEVEERHHLIRALEAVGGHR